MEAPPLQNCFVVDKKYHVKPRRLFDDGAYWRTHPQRSLFVSEDVYTDEFDALYDALDRAKRRRDELNDTIQNLEARLERVRR